MVPAAAQVARPSRSGARRPAVWVVSELYYPEDTSTGHFLTGIAEGLARQYDTTVVCGRPTYAARARPVSRYETRQGVRIVRVPNTRGNPHATCSRLTNLITVSLLAAVELVCRMRRGDVAIVVTNPPTLPWIAWAASRCRGTRLVVLVHDVYPDVLVAIGLLDRSSLAYRALDRATHWLLSRCDRIVVLGRDMARVVSRQAGTDRRVTVIPNWADLELVGPRSPSTELRDRLGLRGKFVVQCGGNMGRTHDLPSLLEAAVRLRTDPDVHLHLFGWGVRRRATERDVADRALSNVTVTPPVVRERLSDTLNLADVAVIPLIDGMEGLSVPSRTYNILAAGTPIIAMTAEDSDLARVIRDGGCGWVVRPGDVDGLVDAVREARRDPSRLVAMAQAARHVAASCTRAAAIERWCRCVGSVLS